MPAFNFAFRLLGLFVLAALLLPAEAFAQQHRHGPFSLHLQNDFNDTIYVAVAYQSTLDNGEWVSEGWYVLEPGESAEADLEGACPATIGIFAETDGGGYVWAGDDPKALIKVDNDSEFKFMLGRKINNPSAKVVQVRQLGVPHDAASFAFTFR